MMLGLATATMVVSIRIMKKPTSMAHNVIHGFFGCLATGSRGWPRMPVAVMPPHPGTLSSVAIGEDEMQ